MLKPSFVIIIALFAFKTAHAQKDTTVYYVKNSGRLVSSKDSADFFLVILPPDTNVSKKLFVVKEFYPNGKIKLIGGATSNTPKFKFQGRVMTFFTNGHKKRTENYEKGEPNGDIVEYFPNGKLYNIKNYDPVKGLSLQVCNDSLGNSLVVDGKGKWVEFTDDFSKVESEGDVVYGTKYHTWRSRVNDSVQTESVFDQGKLISLTTLYKHKLPVDVFINADVVPQFPGGVRDFGAFLGKNIRYPVIARKHNTQGRVILRFIVEKNGVVDDVKVIRGIGDGCDEEAIRVLNLSPAWIPGKQNGKPVRVVMNVPINFTLSSK